METFAKEPEFLKLLWEQKSKPARRYKKFHWFLSYVCNRKFAVFGALLRNNLQMGAFS